MDRVHGGEGEVEDYDSNFGDTKELEGRLKAGRAARREEIRQRAAGSKASNSVFREEAALEEGRRLRQHLLSLTVYDRHKLLVNQYLLSNPDLDPLRRDTTRDKTDLDVVRENHRFIWSEPGGSGGHPDGGHEELTWGQRLAKKYYQRLYHEYCVCDLSRYKENKVAMRWQTEAEVRTGKGQFVCGSRKCTEAGGGLRTWEVNFAYLEEGNKKNALVKVRLCSGCSKKLNYHHQRREVTGKRSAKRTRSGKASSTSPGQKDRRKVTEVTNSSEVLKTEAEKLAEENALEKKASEIWSAPLQIEEEKSRDDDFSEFLEDLFL